MSTTDPLTPCTPTEPAGSPGFLGRYDATTESGTSPGPLYRRSLSTAQSWQSLATFTFSRARACLVISEWRSQRWFTRANHYQSGGRLPLSLAVQVLSPAGVPTMRLKQPDPFCGSLEPTLLARRYWTKRLCIPFPDLSSRPALEEPTLC